VQLRQSPFLSILPEQRLQGTLRLMGRKPDEKITPAIARDICERTASKAMIAGAISQLGQSYVISLDASNCRNGDTIEKRQVQAANKDEVLKALGTAAEQLRRGLGETLASIEKYDAPIQGATTGSLDALKSYSQGMTTRRRLGDTASVPFFRKAIEEDPDFALAHARLSTVYGNMGDVSQSREQITKAYALRDRVSEPERLYIEARYYQTVEDAPQKTIDTYRVWTQTYPKDFVPHHNLAGMYSNRSDNDKAVEEYRTAISLAPDEPLPYGSLAAIYQSQRKLDEARKLLEGAIARGVDSSGLREQLYVFAFLRGDESDMARQIEAARRFPDGVNLLPMRISIALRQGRLARALDLTQQYASEAGALGLKGFVAGVWANVGQAAAVFGDAVAARAAVRASLDIERSVQTLLNNAFASVVCGDVAVARKLLDEAAKMPGASGDDAQSGFKLVEALIRRQQGEKIAAGALPAPKSDTDTGALFAQAIVLLHDGQTDLAAARFKQIADRQDVTVGPLNVVASLDYGRALAAMGKVDESRKAYDQFFAAWKDADPTLPLLVDAKKEYARLTQRAAP